MSDSNEIRIEDIITGRIEPRIYAFKTNTIPSYLKVGDTVRGVQTRLNEWKLIYNDLISQGDWSARIDNTNYYFRDYSVHAYLENHGKHHLEEDAFPDKPYSREFFKNATPKNVEEAIADIVASYEAGTTKYRYLDSSTGEQKKAIYPRGDAWEVRKPLQSDAVEKFKAAINAGGNAQKNLLMYAVMRFGKSFTSLCCAQAMNANVVLVLSAKADVKDEWKQNVEKPGQFKEWVFLDSGALKRNKEPIKALRENGKKVVIFVTLQDLKDINKPKFQELTQTDIDLMIIDETHFGARGETLGKAIANAHYKEDTFLKKQEREASKKDSLTGVEKDDAEKTISEAEKCLKSVKVKLHLSGTPYRILMGGEFKKEDVISFCQYSDIIDQKERWYEENALPKANGGEPKNEWENPYFGFPQMVRFAFNLNESACAKMKKLEEAGYTYKLSALFAPKSVDKDDAGLYKQFEHPDEVLDFLKVIGGEKEDPNIFSFLNNERIVKGQMCHHIVMVLPYCASCDAMMKMIQDHNAELGKLSEYEILNVSGIDSPYSTIDLVKDDITRIEGLKDTPGAKSKTITLTVNRMLTGCTVPEWDTMIYLKDTVSPQDYDQAVFRLQSQYVAKCTDNNGNEIKVDLKPQTLLIDFDPQRMYYLQAEKSKIYNINTDSRGNDEVEARIERDLKISPIIAFNGKSLVEVTPNNIMKAVSDYSVNRSITDEAADLAVDVGLFDDGFIRDIIDHEFELSPKNGINGKLYTGEETDYPADDPTDNGDDDQGECAHPQASNQQKAPEQASSQKEFEKKFRSYYRRILFYAFLTESKGITNLNALIDSINESNPDNERLARHLGLSRKFLTYFRKHVNQFVLLDIDNKIFDLYRLSHDYETDGDVSPITRAQTAIKNFGKLGDSEVVTPSKYAEDMVALIEDAEFKAIFDRPNSRILDIASKMGEFATAIVNRAKTLGIPEEKFKDKICSICTSEIAFEFTRWIYNVLNLDTKTIMPPEAFTTYALLDKKKPNKKDIDYDAIKRLLTHKKNFKDITKNDEPNQGAVEMIKFDAVVGNPPYHEQIDNPRKPPIYHYFYDLSFMLAKNVVLISPGRFLFNGGQTPKEWNKKMLKNQHVRVAQYYADSKSVFGKEIDLKGGVTIIQKNEGERFNPIDHFIENKDIRVILERVKQKQFIPLTTIVYPKSSFNFTKALYEDNPKLKQRLSSGNEYIIDANIFEKIPEVFSEKENNVENAICVRGKTKERVYRYINEKYIKPIPLLYSYKVFITGVNGTGKLGETLSSPEIGLPRMCHTQTFMSIGCFSTENEATACMKYIKTKFARLLLGTLKITHNNPRATWANIPLQDFTDKSDIDWSKSISEIDKQLYAKYNLDQAEIDFIESKVKPME